MKKGKKVKRYVTGDFVDYESSDDARNLLRAAEREAREFKGMDTDVIDETGMKSRLKRNMETGELYDPTGEMLMSKPTPRVRPTPKPAAKVIAERIEEGITSSGMPREARGIAATAFEPAKKPRTFAERQEAASEKMRSARRSSIDDLKDTLRKMFTPTADNPRIRRERAEGTAIRSNMKKGGAVKASSASKRADGIAQRGKTRGRMI